MEFFNSILISNIILWAVFGFCVGLILHLIDRGNVTGGVIGTIVLGILGAVVGGMLATLIFGTFTMGFTIQAFAVAVGGGLLLSLIHRLLFRDTGHIKTTTTSLR